MEYLGIDVHSKASVWCLLGEDGEVRARGRVETTVPALGELVEELSRQDDLRVGQEVGTMAYLVHDAIAGAGAEILSFNAHQLRMIASSRKKTDQLGPREHPGWQSARQTVFQEVLPEATQEATRGPKSGG